ncbi:hypothetical protein DQ04_15911020, partial [Trypanosoma grayi]|uniref:hypothetical protein n=1 Tax=Trypanosoma grayi TaxID=71804 RepID=UPI0004F3FC7E
QPPLSRSCDSVASSASWPPSVASVGDSLLEDGADVRAVQRDVTLRSLLDTLAASAACSSVPERVLHPLLPAAAVTTAGGVVLASAQQHESHESGAAASASAQQTLLPLAVELCRVVRPFARRLLLLLTQESGGHASVTPNTCAEAVNCVLESEGVRGVRATRRLCRHIAVMHGVLEDEGQRNETVPYASFVASVVQLAEEA